MESKARVLLEFSSRHELGRRFDAWHAAAEAQVYSRLNSVLKQANEMLASPSPAHGALTLQPATPLPQQPQLLQSVDAVMAAEHAHARHLRWALDRWRQRVERRIMGPAPPLLFASPPRSTHPSPSKLSQIDTPPASFEMVVLRLRIARRTSVSALHCWRALAADGTRRHVAARRVEQRSLLAGLRSLA